MYAQETAISSENHKEWAEVSRLGAAVHRLKILRHQLLRKVRDTGTIRTWSQSSKSSDCDLAANVQAQLWFEVPKEEWVLEAGKVENVRLAAQKLDGLEIPANAIFSFWHHIGRPSAQAGFVVGREIRAGCVIPTIAGGLCLLSNALYKAALEADLEIVERHGHTQQLFTDASDPVDATVFWNYVDLRFRSSKPWRLETEMTDTHLHIRIHQAGAKDKRTAPSSLRLAGASVHGVRSCYSCDIDTCRHSRVEPALEARRAILLDTYWPEFQRWLQTNLRPNDLIYMPIDGSRRGFSRYSWDLEGAEIVEFPLAFGLRAATARVYSKQGPEMRAAQMRMDAFLATSMARMLPPTVTELIVGQHLLPHLHKQGALGGRKVEVFATRQSLARIQERLDLASQQWPDRTTLRDFRVDPEQVELEAQAFERVRRFLTPNRSIAADYGARATLIDWVQDNELHRLPSRRSERPVVHLPGSTVARLGACELREALRGLDVTLEVSGRNLEDEEFWAGFTQRPCGGLEEADLVVLPAWLPHNPRPLLRAAALGIPVIVSDVFGLGGVPGVVEVPCGDVHALRTAIKEILSLPSRTEPGFPTEIVKNFVEKMCLTDAPETYQFPTRPGFTGDDQYPS